MSLLSTKKRITKAQCEEIMRYGLINVLIKGQPAKLVAGWMLKECKTLNRGVDTDWMEPESIYLVTEYGLIDDVDHLRNDLKAIA